MGKKHTWIFRCEISSIILYYSTSTKWQNLYNSFGCLWCEEIQVSCPKLKMIRITILIVQAKYLFLFQTQKDLDSFTGIKSRLILLFSIISVTINNWKHKSEFPSHSSLYQNYLWVYWLTEGNVASILLSLYYITKV